MKRSILHKETFTTRNTDVSSYLDDMVINEETLQLEAGPKVEAAKGFVKWLVGGVAKPTTLQAGKNTLKLGAGATALGAIGLGGKKAFELIDKIGQSAGDLFDKDTWVGTAMTIGVGTAGALALYNLFKNWMANKEETKRQQQARA